MNFNLSIVDNEYKLQFEKQLQLLFTKIPNSGFVIFFHFLISDCKWCMRKFIHIICIYIYIYIYIYIPSQAWHTYWRTKYVRATLAITATALESLQFRNFPMLFMPFNNFFFFFLGWGRGDRQCQVMTVIGGQKVYGSDKINKMLLILLNELNH